MLIPVSLEFFIIFSYQVFIICLNLAQRTKGKIEDVKTF